LGCGRRPPRNPRMGTPRPQMWTRPGRHRVNRLTLAGSLSLGPKTLLAATEVPVCLVGAVVRAVQSRPGQDPLFVPFRDRRFGIELFPYFSHVFMAAMAAMLANTSERRSSDSNTGSPGNANRNRGRLVSIRRRLASPSKHSQRTGKAHG